MLSVVDWTDLRLSLKPEVGGWDDCYFVQAKIEGSVYTIKLWIACFQPQAYHLQMV